MLVKLTFNRIWNNHNKFKNYRKTEKTDADSLNMSYTNDSCWKPWSTYIQMRRARISCDIAYLKCANENCNMIISKYSRKYHLGVTKNGLVPVCAQILHKCSPVHAQSTLNTLWARPECALKVFDKSTITNIQTIQVDKQGLHTFRSRNYTERALWVQVHVQFVSRLHLLCWHGCTDTCLVGATNPSDTCRCLTTSRLQLP